MTQRDAHDTLLSVKWVHFPFVLYYIILLKSTKIQKQRSLGKQYIKMVARGSLGQAIRSNPTMKETESPEVHVGAAHSVLGKLGVGGKGSRERDGSCSQPCLPPLTRAWGCHQTSLGFSSLAFTQE